MPNKLITVKEAAALLGLSHWTLYSWGRKGEGPKRVLMGKSVRYRPEVLQEFIERQST